MNSGNVQPIRPSLGLVADLRPGHREPEPAGFVVLCPGKPVVGPQLWSNSFLPASTRARTSTTRRSTRRRSSATSRTACPPDEQRRQLDLLQAMNELHLAERGPDSQLEARIESLEMAYRMQFEALDVFDLAQGAGDGPRPLRHGRVRRRLPDRPPAGRARRARGADLLRQRPAVGRPQGHHQPPRPRRQERPADRGAARRPEGPRAAGRHAGDLGRRVRPHADERGRRRAATTTAAASRCGWPAAA